MPDPASSSLFKELVGLATSGFSLRDAWVFESRPLLADRKRKVSPRNSGHIITLTPRFKSRLPRFKPWAAPDWSSRQRQISNPCLPCSEDLLRAASLLSPEPEEMNRLASLRSRSHSVCVRLRER